MGVMNTMRANMAGIMIFLVVVFVLTMSVGGLVGGADIMDVITGDKSDAFTVVNGEEITRDDFIRALTNERENYRQQNDAELTDQQLDQMAEQVWETLVTQILIRQEIEKYDIGITDEELRYYFTESIHPIIQNNFAPEGAFDYDLYQQAVNDPQYAPVFRYWRQQIAGVVPVEKLQQQVFTTAHVSEAELRAEFDRQNRVYDLEYLFVKASMWQDAEMTVTEAEIANFYDLHIDEYQQEETRVMDYVSLALTPTANDTDRVLSLMADIVADIEAGESFESQAQIHSIDPSSADGGYLGWFGRGRMVKPFEDAAYTADPGEIVGPVLSQFGYHLIRVDSSRVVDGNRELEARHILLDIKPSETTRNNMRRELRNLEFLAEEIGFDAAVDSMAYEMQTANRVKPGDTFVAGLGPFQSAVSFAYRSELGTFSSLMQNEEHLAIFRLTTINPAGARSLEEIERGIERRMINERRLEAARLAADSLRGELAENTDFSAVTMTREGLGYDLIEGARSSSSIKGLGRYQTVYGYLTQADAGSISPVLETPRGHVIIKLLAKSDFDETAFTTQKEMVRASLEQTRRNEAWSNYLEDLRDDAKIIDNRLKFL